MAIRINIGRAQNIAQVDTITIGGTVTAGTDTVWIECSDKRITLTCGSTMDTTAEVAAGVAEMINATHHDETLFTADFTCNAGGYEYEEFKDMVATASGSVVTITSATPGWPFTITSGKSGTLTATHNAEATAATGQWHFDNADNWNTAPIAGDVCVYDEGSSSTYFALDNTLADLSIQRRSSFRGDIGLPPINRKHGEGYPEYRQTALDVPLTSSTGSQTHKIGDPESSLQPGGYTALDMGTNTPDSAFVTVYDAPDLGPEGGPSVLIRGGKELTLTVFHGFLGVGMKPTDNQSLVIACNLLKDKKAGSPPRVFLGELSSVTSGDTLRVEVGDLIYDPSGGSADINVYGGEVTQLASFASMQIHDGGVVRHLAGNITAGVVYGGGEFDARSGDAFTMAALVLYKGFIYRDRMRATYSTGIDFVGCRPDSGEFDVDMHKTWTPSTI